MAEKKVRIFIPSDPQNENYKAIRFQRDGVDFWVVRGKEQLVPEWVRDCAIQAGYIEQ